MMSSAQPRNDLGKAYVQPSLGYFVDKFAFFKVDLSCSHRLWYSFKHGVDFEKICMFHPRVTELAHLAQKIGVLAGWKMNL